MAISVDVATEVTPDLLTALRSLMRQLDFHLTEAELPELHEAQVARAIASPGTTLLVARNEAGQIVGTTTLATFDTPTGRRAWIEDVVVDASARGQGVGERLVREAIRL